MPFTVFIRFRNLSRLWSLKNSNNQKLSIKTIKWTPCALEIQNLCSKFRQSPSQSSKWLEWTNFQWSKKMSLLHHILSLSSINVVFKCQSFTKKICSPPLYRRIQAKYIIMILMMTNLGMALIHQNFFKEEEGQLQSKAWNWEICQNILRALWVQETTMIRVILVSFHLWPKES